MIIIDDCFNVLTHEAVITGVDMHQVRRVSRNMISFDYNIASECGNQKTYGYKVGNSGHFTDFTIVQLEDRQVVEYVKEHILTKVTEL